MSICHPGIPIWTKFEKDRVNIFMLCESVAGCLLSFIIYTGSATKYQDQPNRLLMELHE